jgi:recombination protein RecR
MDALTRLSTLLSRLPGFGKKSAQRISYYLLDGDPAYCQALAAALGTLHESLRKCPLCGAWTDADSPGGLCPICGDSRRDRSLLCVVAKAQDIQALEESREYNGLFHVLGGLIAPLDGVTPDKLSIGALVSRARQGEIREIILALNPTIEGDTTALYVQREIADIGNSIVVSRLASGLPAGGDLEYADRLTLSRSLRGRVKM